MQRNNSIDIKKLVKEQSILVILLGFVIISSIFVPNFLRTPNLINILRQSSALVVISLGMFFVIVTGGFDISIGSVIGFSGVVLGTFVSAFDMNLYVAMIIVLILGIGIGLVNGLMVVYGEVQPFIATLATMIVVKGINFLVSGGIPVSGFSREFGQLGRGYVGIIPIPVIIMLAVVAVCYVFMSRTETGRSIYAVGGNEEASRLSGIRTDRIKLLVYILSGFMASLGGILIASRIMAGQPTVGDNMIFDIVTAVVLGGTAMSGGKGKVTGVLAAALLLGVISNSMVLLRIGAYWQWVIRGTLLAVAVLIDTKVNKE